MTMRMGKRAWSALDRSTRCGEDPRPEKTVLSWAGLRVILALAFLPAAVASLPAQEKLPAPPADTNLVYRAAENGDLVAIPVESGRASFNTAAIATRDQKGYVEFDGALASAKIEAAEPRLYLFVPRAAGAHPAFVVRLELSHGKRRVPILAQKGLAGFAVPTDHIVIPHYRVLTTVGELLFMEITPRSTLLPGEYAVLGDDLKRIATFQVVASSTR